MTNLHECTLKSFMSPCMPEFNLKLYSEECLYMKYILRNVQLCK